MSDLGAYEGHLDELVVRVAERLMSASEDKLAEAVDWTVETLAGFLHVDGTFLRRNDHEAGVSVLIAEHPRRGNTLDQDPSGIVSFDAHPVLAAGRSLRVPLLGGRTTAPDGYGERMSSAAGVGDFSGVAVPLLRGEVTTGILGFVHCKDREWSAPELITLRAIASLLVHLETVNDAQARLRHMALHDDLTGLANRRAAIEEIDKRLECADNCVALLFIDLDHFKVMNDQLGHRAGDRVLAHIADRIRDSTPPDGFAARLGGDEFVVLLDGGDGAPRAVATADRQLELVSQPIDLGGTHVSHTGSIGIAIGHPGQVTGDELLARADIALYAAKAHGRGKVAVFDDVLAAKSDERSRIETALRAVLAYSSWLDLRYQPEIDLRTGEVVAAETIFSCRDREQRVLEARDLIDVAERTGLIGDLGHRVLEGACREMAAMRRRVPHREFGVRVSISPVQLTTSGSVADIAGCLRRSGLPPSCLSLEITGHAFTQDADQTVAVLSELGAQGIGLALDDLHTGFGWIPQLKNLALTAMKIDAGLVRGLEDDPINRAVVEGIVHIARALDLPVVAEGIEAKEDLRAVRSLGCDRGQGGLLAEPMGTAPLRQLLEKGPIDILAREG